MPELTTQGERIEHRLQRSAEVNGDRIAFECRDDQITYSNLLQRSSALAVKLQEHGLESGARVGIVMFKSIEMPVAVYGVLAANCVYVPVDPLVSASRLAQIIADCSITCLICDRYSLKKIKDIAVASRLLVVGDDDCRDACIADGVRSFAWSDALADSTAPPSTSDGGSSSAYIIYTSGTTGIPKGIEHTHESALSYVDACVDTWRFTQDDRFANHSPLHFDMATMEFLVAPAVGARTTLIPDDVMKIPASIAELIETRGITTWYSVPFALVQLLDSGSLGARDLSSLNNIIFAGEVFPVAKLRQLCELLPEVKFSNAYGPTETNVCTVHHLDRATLAGVDVVPIGRPWSSSATRIENDTGSLVAPGEVGELLVTGGTLMKGYWERPELNADAFAGREDTLRYYRTGDLVYEDTGGIIYLCGRKDRQVKHRGYRIELDEIEAVLHGHPDVSHAAAFIHPNRDEIVAVVSVSDRSTDVLKSLRKRMRERLPSYAIPDSLLACSNMPLSANNKIDRIALGNDIAQVEREHHAELRESNLP